MPRLLSPVLFASILVAAAAGRQHGLPQASASPRPEPSGWAAEVDHPLLPLRPGSTYVYTTRPSAEGMDSVTVTHETKVILGITATAVRDRTFHKGALAEESVDWYAQDRDGNVWYLGEDTKEWRDGKVVSTAGSWEAGKNGAQPGIMMKVRPRVGDTYREERRRGVAEDMARVLSLDEEVTVPSGKFQHCLMTEEWSPLDPGVREHKYYAPGVGLVLDRTVAGGNEEWSLVRVVEP